MNQPLVRQLARCEYVERGENVIAIGNSGTGKTHVALGLGLAACQRGLSVGFTTAAALVNELLEARDERRLVRTFFLALAAMVRLRHNRSGLLLSELGAHIISPDRAPAGTKRLSNLLRSPRWSHNLLERFLWRRADQNLIQLQERDELALAIWDESVLEKPENIALEGLCPVRSSKAARLKRIKPGYYNPPGGPPVFVPGLQWLTVMVAGMQGPPNLAAMRWWTSRGQLASHRREQMTALLAQCARRWQRRVVHVFDRGFAGAPWLKELTEHQVRFIVRWPTRYHLADARGERPAWQITRGKRSQDHRQVWDLHRRQYRKTGIVAVPVRHPHMEDALWLVVSRPGKGRKPWYLLTNQELNATDDAWRVVFAYARRWQVEMCYRACKTDLAMESPRLWFWGEPAQAPAYGQPALLFPPDPAGPTLPASAARPVTKLVP